MSWLKLFCCARRRLRQSVPSTRDGRLHEAHDRAGQGAAGQEHGSSKDQQANECEYVRICSGYRENAKNDRGETRKALQNRRARGHFTREELGPESVPAAPARYEARFAR